MADDDRRAEWTSDSGDRHNVPLGVWIMLAIFVIGTVALFVMST